MKDEKYSVCILTTSSIDSDPRVLKQIYKYQEMKIYMVIAGYDYYHGICQVNGEYYPIRQVEELQPSLKQRITKIIKKPQNLITGTLRRLKPIIYKLLLLFAIDLKQFI